MKSGKSFPRIMIHLHEKSITNIEVFHQGKQWHKPLHPMTTSQPHYDVKQCLNNVIRLSRDNVTFHQDADSIGNWHALVYRRIRLFFTSLTGSCLSGSEGHLCNLYSWCEPLIAIVRQIWPIPPSIQRSQQQLPGWLRLRLLGNMGHLYIFTSHVCPVVTLQNLWALVSFDRCIGGCCSIKYTLLMSAAKVQLKTQF